MFPWIIFRLGLIEEPLLTNEESNVESSPDADGIQVLEEEIVGPDGDANITRSGNPEEDEVRSDTTSSLDETDIGMKVKHTIPLINSTSSC